MFLVPFVYFAWFAVKMLFIRWLRLNWLWRALGGDSKTKRGAEFLTAKYAEYAKGKVVLSGLFSVRVFRVVRGLPASLFTYGWGF